MYVQVTKNKKWREVSTSLNLGASSSAGFTLKRNYAKFLFPFECRYDRGNIDPAPIILSMEMSSKKETKKNSDRSVDMGKILYNSSNLVYYTEYAGLRCKIMMILLLIKCNLTEKFLFKECTD